MSSGICQVKNALEHKLDMFNITMEIHKNLNEEVLFSTAEMHEGLHVLHKLVSKLKELAKQRRQQLSSGQDLFVQRKRLLEMTEHGITKSKDIKIISQPKILKPAPVKEIKERRKTLIPKVQNSRVSQVAGTSINRPSVKSVAYLTVDEFQTLPKYMVGRFEYRQLQTGIDDFNAAVKKKYDLCLRPKSTLSGVELKKWKEYKQLEVQEVKNECFVTREDLKEMASFKAERIYSSFITIFRHCNRIKDVRLPKEPVRHVVM